MGTDCKFALSGIRGLWGKLSDNTTIFNKKIIEEGLTLEKAAFETWSGQRALENGFDKVRIDFLKPNQPPYESITVTFYK